jgi:RNA polymerase sigma factor (sigma-70 family)
MRIADPAQLKLEAPLESVLTAVMPPFVVENLSHALRDVDQFNSPGPAKMAALELEAGPTVAVVYHETKNLLEILAPLGESLEQSVAEVLTVLRIPRTSIEWVRKGLVIHHLYTEERAALDRIGVDNPDIDLEALPELTLAESVHVIRRRQLHAAIAELSDAQRQCLRLWLDDLQYDEIAAVLGISINAVRSRLRDANKILGAQLQDKVS